MVKLFNFDGRSVAQSGRLLDRFADFELVLDLFVALFSILATKSFVQFHLQIVFLVLLVNFLVQLLSLVFELTQ